MSQNYFRQYNSACARADKFQREKNELEEKYTQLENDFKAVREEKKNLEYLLHCAETQLQKTNEQSREAQNIIAEKDEQIKSLNDKIEQLQRYIKNPQEDQDEEIRQLKNKLEEAKAKSKRNSQITSTPSGRAIDTPNAESKAVNTYNGRKPSGKKQGGQPGHKYHNLEVKDLEKLLEDKSVIHKIIEYGDSESEYRTVYEVDVICQTIVIEHRIHEDYEPSPSDPIAPPKDRQVIYGSNVKALTAVFNVKFNLSHQKVSSLLSMLSEGKISPCKGSSYNWVKLFVEAAKEEKLELERKLLQEETVYTDSTVMVVGGKTRNNVRVCASKNGPTVYTALETKTKEEIANKTMLGAFLNTTVSDHEAATLKFGKVRQECVVHILRYLRQNSLETGHEWSDEMFDLLTHCIHERKVLLEEAQKAGIEVTSFPEEFIDSVSKKYDEILEKGFEENKADSDAWYYSQELALLNRMRNFKEDTLYFLSHFHTDPDNNLSERKLRTCKLKQKNSGGFRTFAGLSDYSDILTLFDNHESNSELLPDLRNLLSRSNNQS